MLFEIKPENFKPKFEIVSCFIECDKKILLLLRQDAKPEGNTWGIPTGKIDDQEDSRKAVLRELKEETGLNVSQNEIIFLKDLFMRFPKYDFKASVFRFILKNQTEITINPSEHKEFLWTEISNAFNFPLIYDLNNWLRYFYKI